MPEPLTIVETSCNSLFRVVAAGDGLDHVWIGVAVKRVAGGYADKAKAKPHLVRKAGSRVVAVQS